MRSTPASATTRTTCSWCHNPAKTSSGWSVDSTAFVHAIHASAKRTVPYNWHAVSATEGFFDVTFPGILNDCQTCHLPGTFDFSATPGQALSSAPASYGRPGNLHRLDLLSPYVAVGPNYGNGFSLQRNHRRHD